MVRATLFLLYTYLTAVSIAKYCTSNFSTEDEQKNDKELENKQLYISMTSYIRMASYISIT
jgi:hypothetical protein